MKSLAARHVCVIGESDKNGINDLFNYGLCACKVNNSALTALFASMMRRCFIIYKEKAMIHIACVRVKRDKIPVYSEAMGV